MSRLETHDTDWGNLANVLQSDGVAEPVQNPVEERQRWLAALDGWLLEWA